MSFSKTEIGEIESETQNPFTLSAWSSDGKLLDIDEYCEKYNLPIDNVRSYKLVSHTGIPFYNIQFKEESINTVYYRGSEKAFAGKCEKEQIPSYRRGARDADV